MESSIWPLQPQIFAGLRCPVKSMQTSRWLFLMTVSRRPGNHSGKNSSGSFADWAQESFRWQVVSLLLLLQELPEKFPARAEFAQRHQLIEGFTFITEQGASHPDNKAVWAVC